MEIDLTQNTGKYNLTVNAEISSQSGYDYGYATVTETQTAPTYNTSEGRFIYISGTVEAKDYTTVLQGGKKYYLHLGYRKNESTDTGEDKFTINSVNVTLNDSELYHTEVETNLEGKAITQIPFGKYNVTETQAPEGYEINTEPTIIEFRSNGTSEFTIEDIKKAKITVHHYIATENKNESGEFDGTYTYTKEKLPINDTQVAEDEVYEGKVGEKYTTLPHTDSEKYELIVDETGKYILPTNAIGEYTETDQEITYYYVKKKIKLTVHHYIQNTEEEVPLANGTKAEEERAEGNEGEEYTTKAKTKEELDSRYELVSMPENAKGKYAYPEVEVTYEYKLKQYEVTTEVKTHEEADLAGNVTNVKGGSILGEEQTPYEVVTTGEDSKKEVTIKAKEGYEIKEITIQTIQEDGSKTEEKVDLSKINPEGKVTTYTLDKFTKMTANKHIIVEFAKKQGSVVVHHYVAIENKGTDGKYNGTYTYTEEKVPSKVEGETVEDEIKTGSVGDMYVTKETENKKSIYKLVGEPENASGNIEEEQIVVNYYYTLKNYNYSIEYYYDGEKDETATEIGEQKYGDQITTYKDKIKPGYKLEKVEGNPITIKEDESKNVMKIYYIKRTDLSYIVNYYEEGTTTKVANSKTEEGRTYLETIIEQAIEVEGYTKVEPTEKTIQIQVTGNEINFYYKKRSDLPYIVKYLEQGTNEVLHEQKDVENQVFLSKVTEQAEEISGYNLVGENSKKIEITTGKNEIIFYYTKRTDLSYIVNYYEEGTTTKVANSKEEEGKTYLEEITEQAIEVDGYTKVEPIEKTIQIQVTGNEINFYYKKRTDIGYTIEYYYNNRKDNAATITEKGEFQSQITEYPDKAKTGYKFEKVEGKPITLVTDETKNIMKVYYITDEAQTKILTYTVEYYKDGVKQEKDTQTQSQTVQVLEPDTLQVKKEEINITNKYDGYRFEKIEQTANNSTHEINQLPDKVENGNILKIYYVKRNDLAYTVKYLEEGTNAVLHEQKDVENQIFASKITEQAEVISGYNLVGNNSQTIEITTGKNEIIFYYAKKTDLGYVVNYYEEGTTTKVANSKIVEEKTYLEEITEQAIEVDGYTKIEPTEKTIQIQVTGNEINFYYKKRSDLTYTVKYLEEGTNAVLYEQKDVENQIFASKVTEQAEIISGYDLVSKSSQTIEITTGKNEIIFYYKKGTFKYTVEYYYDGIKDESGTEEKTATYKDKITTYTKKLKPTFRLEKEEGLPLIITARPEKNIIKIYYVRKDAQITIKYVDRNTEEEISDQVTHVKQVGDKYDITEDKKDVPGYTLIEEPQEKTGEYKEEPQEKTYYYAKNTEVIVKYLEKGTNKVIAKEEKIEGYEGKEYKTEKKEIEGYTYIKDTENTEGEMTREAIEVIYYYLPNTNVIVRYLEIDDTPEDNEDNKELLKQEQIKGYIGKKYKTEKKEVEGYTYIKSTTNTEGAMSKEPIEVIYYYAKNTKVIVRYLEKDKTPNDNTDNKELTIIERDAEGNLIVDENGKPIETPTRYEIKGYEGKEYETEKKDIPDYTFVESTENTKGVMTKEEIEVIYYYLKNTSAKVEHIDKLTGKILKEEEELGKEGDIFKTKAESFEGYVLIEKPEKEEVEMEKDKVVVVKYYYMPISAGVIEKHIDYITGELLENEVHEGKVADKYEIPSKKIQGYDLVEKDEEGNSMLPENSKGTMTKEVIEVKYYYIKKATVKAEYIDILTNKKLTEDEIQEKHEKDKYKTEEKKFNNYKLVEKPKNATGIVEITKNPDGTYNTEIIVKYYYIQIAGGVKEKHIDYKTNKVIEEETHEGNVGDEYNIPSKKFPSYDLVEKDEKGKNILPENSKGKMTEKEIEVKYYYIKKSTVKVEYVDKDTGKLLDKDEIIGHEGDKYKTEEKKFDKYELVAIGRRNMSNEEIGTDSPDSTIPVDGDIDRSKTYGTMEKEEIKIIYYYKKKAEVEIKYLEKNTNYQISETDKIEGHINDKYETNPKDSPYYRLIESTQNTKGEMGEEKTTVIYYYEKLNFNLKLDKWVSTVEVNGEEKPARTIETKDNLYKLEIHRKKIGTATVKVKYKIRITNTGEIEGTADKIAEIIPEGYTYYAEDNTINWKKEENAANVKGTRLATTDLEKEVIKPGEYKEIEIVLRWNNGEKEGEISSNISIISSTLNPAKFADTIEEDNSSTAKTMIVVSTGSEQIENIMMAVDIVTILVLTAGIIIYYKKINK